MILVAVGAAVPADAQDSTSDEWQFNIAPLYLWASDLDGTLTARDQDIAFQLPFDQAFDNLETAFTFRFEAWKGRWGILTDFSYMDLSSDKTVGPLELNVSLENLIAEVSGAYLFDEAAFIYLGARYYGVDSAVTGPMGRELPGRQELGRSDRRIRLAAQVVRAMDLRRRGGCRRVRHRLQLDVEGGGGHRLAGGAVHRPRRRLPGARLRLRGQTDGFAYDLLQQGPGAFLRFFW